MLSSLVERKHTAEIRGAPRGCISREITKHAQVMHATLVKQTRADSGANTRAHVSVESVADNDDTFALAGVPLPLEHFDRALDDARDPMDVSTLAATKPVAPVPFCFWDGLHDELGKHSRAWLREDLSRVARIKGGVR